MSRWRLLASWFGAALPSGVTRNVWRLFARRLVATRSSAGIAEPYLLAFLISSGFALPVAASFAVISTGLFQKVEI